jgi:acetyltransferase-like isoleucine patch superfamily enzyme
MEISEDSELLLGRALDHYQAGELAESEILCHQLLVLNPEEARALNLLACLYHKSGSLEQALDLVLQAILLDPERIDYYRNAGLIYYEFREFDNSIDAFKMVISLGDRSAENYDWLINALEAANRHSEAKSILLEKSSLYKFYLPYTRNFTQYRKYRIGEFTYGAPIVKDWHQGSTLVIGNFTSIAENVTILLGGNHPTDWVSTFPFGMVFDDYRDQHYSHSTATKGDVIIGNDVWIGLNTIILSGVEIGDGAVVGAGSIVTKNVDPYTIVGGNPAKLIKRRFSEDNIDNLLRIRWWNWDIEKIKDNLHLILSDNIGGFIDKHL